VKYTGAEDEITVCVKGIKVAVVASRRTPASTLNDLDHSRR